MYNGVNHFGIIAPILKIAVCMVCYTALICVAFIIEQQKVTTTVSIVLYNYIIFALKRILYRAPIWPYL